MDLPGGQSVYIVTDVPRVDGAGVKIRDKFLNEIIDERELRVDGCLFEAQVGGTSPASVEVETESVTTTTEVRWLEMPVVDGHVPAYDEADGDAVVLVAVDSISSTKAIREGDRTYEMRGDAVLEIDGDGLESHVFALCERQNG